MDSVARVNLESLARLGLGFWVTLWIVTAILCLIAFLAGAWWGGRYLRILPPSSD